jgi:hypothetical protein
MEAALRVVKASQRKKKEAFSPEEDAKLRDLVAARGTVAWSEISDHLPGRSGRQCRERWQLYLAPEVNNDPWSLEEEQRLLTLYFRLGPRWTLIANSFPDRTSNNVKNKAKHTFRRMQKTLKAGDAVGAKAVAAPAALARRPPAAPRELPVGRDAP